MKFSDALKKQDAGQTIKVRIDISREGILDDVQMDESPDAGLMASVSTQMSYWLFILRVKNGETQPAAIVLPIKF